MSSLAASFKDSPRQIRKKMGKESYNLTQAAEDDPFLNGITFHVTYLGSGYHPTGVGEGCTNDVVTEVWRQSQESRNVGKKMSIVVTDKSLKLKDMTTKMVVDDIPLYRVSYCGTDRRHRVVFAFVAKEMDTGKMKVHVTRADNEKKVQAMCMTVSRAFSIAYKSWQYKNRKIAKDNSPHSSPKAVRRDNFAKAPANPSPTLTAKMAQLKPPSAVPVAMIPTLAPPPASPSQLRVQKIPVKPAPQQIHVVHTGSPLIAPASTHRKVASDTDEINDEFSNLAKARSHPDLLDSNADEEFNMATVKEQADPGSVENLLDL